MTIDTDSADMPRSSRAGSAAVSGSAARSRQRYWDGLKTRGQFQAFQVAAVAEWAILVLWSMTGLGFITVAIVRGRASSWYGALFLVNYAMPVLLILILAAFHIGFRHFTVRRVRGARGCPCVQCGHSLWGLPRFARCPECGAFNDVVRIKQFWDRHAWTRSSPATAVERRRKWWTGIIALSTVFVVAVLSLAFHGPFHIFAIMPFALIGIAMDDLVFRRRLRRRIVESRFQLCPRCGTSLVHEKVGQCPKCRKAYARRVIIAQWRMNLPPSWERDVRGLGRRRSSVTTAGNSGPFR